MSGDYRGRFLWHELLTIDPEKAQRFYKSVAPWGTQAYPGSTPPYVMWMKGEAPVGGVMELPPHLREQKTPPHWLSYVGTPSVDDSLAQAQKLGAMPMVPPFDIPDIGRIAVLGDPQGAVFALYTPAGAPTDETPPTPGDFSWHELITTDYAKAFDFYSKLLGWVKTDEHDMGPMGIYLMFGRPGGPPLGGMFTKPAGMPAPANWLPYIMVPDIKTAAATIPTSGGKVMNGPMEVPGGDWIVQGSDPQGGFFALHQAKRN